MSVPVGLQDPSRPRDTNRLPLRRTGVYPLEIELRDASDRGIEGTRFVTQAVVVAPGSNGAPPIAKRLQVAWIWPLVDGPSRRLDDSRRSQGARGPAARRPARPPGRRTRPRRTASRSHSSLDPETLEAWAALARTEPALRAPASGPSRHASRPTRSISGSYVPDRHGLAARPRPQRRRRHRADPRRGGAEHLLRGTYRHRHRVRTARPSGSALSRLRNGNVDRVVVDEAAFVAPSRPERFTRASPFLVQTTTTVLPVELPRRARDRRRARTSPDRRRARRRARGTAPRRPRRSSRSSSPPCRAARS